jgi:hypothetical protein
MALTDIVQRTRAILYGTELGSKPAFRIAATNAAESVSGPLVTFTLDTGEGAKCKPGQILSVYDPDTEANAHAVYITSISSTTSDIVTGVNEYLGSPAIAGADSGDLDDALLEQNPMVTMYEIYEAVDTVFAHLLYPWVYDITTATITTPDLVDGQEAVAAEAKEILHAWQIIGGTNYPIEFQSIPYDVSTSMASTGRMATFEPIDGSTIYYTYKEPLAEADDTGDELTHIVAMGAAALLVGGHLVDTTLARTKQDNPEALTGRQQVGGMLWRDFLTLRGNYQEELVRRIPSRIRINRG